MGLHKADSLVSAVVLAAGMSKRMGSPKQLLRLGGRPILERTIANVRESAVREIILVLGAAADAIEKQISTEGLQVVCNADYQQGMGTSLRSGLAAVDSESNAALVVLADQPFVQPSTLNKLIEYHCLARPQILIPTYQGFRGNPVLLDRAVFPELRELSGDLGCRAIFGNHTQDIHKLPVDDAGILLDIDSADDVEKANRTRAELGNPGAAALEIRENTGIEGPELVLVGHNAVVHALAKLGRLLQFTVTIIDPFLHLAEVPEADRVLHALDFSKLPVAGERYAVVASRGQFDEEAIQQALQADTSYLALLAGQKRAQELREALRRQGITQEDLRRIRVPAGLEIGAETPEEIALSIMAEVVSERRRHKGQRS